MLIITTIITHEPFINVRFEYHLEEAARNMDCRHNDEVVVDAHALNS